MKEWATPDNEQERGFSLLLMPPEKSWYMGNDDVDLGEVEVLFSPPEEMTEQQMRLKAIKTLEAKQKRLIAEAQNEVTKLQSRIDGMKLLTHVV